MENNIKIVRLQSGEDIIAEYSDDKENDMVLLDKPMHVVFKRLPTGKTVMMMMPWLPVELIKENSAIIDAADILTVVEPRDELVSYYINAAFQTEELLGDEQIGESLMMSDEEDEDEYYDEEEQQLTLEEMQEIMKEQKNNKLH
jgi:hypothetical protein